MTSRAHHESIWEGVPEGLEPPDARLREVFLIEQLALIRARGDGPSTVRAHGEGSAAMCAGGESSSAVRVLDVGCGEGYFAAALARAGADVVAVDVASEPLRRLRTRHPVLDAQLVAPDAPLPFADCSFDLVWAGETIEHVADTAGWLSELRRVLRSGGLVALSTPDHGPLTRLRAGLSRRAFEARFDPRADHLRFYTRPALATLLGDFGFEEVVVRAAGGVPGARRVLLASGRRRRF